MDAIMVADARVTARLVPTRQPRATDSEGRVLSFPPRAFLPRFPESQMTVGLATAISAPAGRTFSRDARRERHNVLSRGGVVTPVARDGRLRGHQVPRARRPERRRRALQESTGTSSRDMFPNRRRRSSFLFSTRVASHPPPADPRCRPRSQAQEEGFGTPVEARDADRAFPPPVAATPTFASTPAWVGTKRGSAPGVPTPLTWAAKSEWPGGMMTPRFDGAGVYNTPEGSWLTGPVPFFDPSANGNENAQEKENVARALPLTPMSTGRFKADAATAAASASDENENAIVASPVSGASHSASVSKPTSKSPVPFRKSPKSISRLSRVLASPARGTEIPSRAAENAKTPSSAKRSLGETFATKKRVGVSSSPSPDVDIEGAFLEYEDASNSMVSVDMMTPSPSRRSGRLDSPVSQSVHASGKKSASARGGEKRHAGTPPKTPRDSRGRHGAASPAAKMQAHALVSLANLREEMDEKERVWGDALAEAEAELAGAKLEASKARAELAEEKAKTPEKLPGLSAKPGTPPREETPSPSPKSAVKSDVHDDDRVNASENPSSENPKTSVFLQAKTHSLEREVARLTAQLASSEASHARAMDVEARKAKARVDAAKEETAAAFAREKDLWAEVHKLRERADLETTAARDVQLKSLRSELEEERKAHKEASRRAAAAESSRSAAAEDAERFRLESDALAESLAETTKRLESVTHVKEASVREAFETKAVAEKKHRDELAQFEEALAEARAALEASTSAERRAETDAEAARADAEARVVTERETNRQLAADLESMKDTLEREKKEHKKEKQRLETRLEDAERRVAVAEIDAETRREKEEARADAAAELEKSFEARVASVSASAKKSESARAEAALRRAEAAEAELENVHAELAGAEEREKKLAAEKLAAEKLASASSSRAEAAEADAAAARATAESVRVAAAADRESAAESERALRAQKADAAFQLAEAARDAAEKERRGADLEASVAEAEALARETRAELLSVRGDLASARAEAAASAREATAAAKARENADVKAREASCSSAAALSELAALKSEHARVVAELAASRAAARGGEDAASRLSAVEATREAIALELETAASKEQALHGKIRNLEVELERARAAAAAARLEKEEAEAEREDVGRKLETALADVSRGNRAFRRPSAAGSAPSTPVDARRTRHGSAGRNKRAVPATTGKGRTPARRHARDDDDDEDSFASDTTASGSLSDADDADVEASPLGATPAAVAGLVGLARARLGTPSPSRRASGGALRERRESPSAGGRSPSGKEAQRRRLAAQELAFLKESRRRRFLASASFAASVSVFAFLVAAARGATGSGACAGGLFGVVATFAEEWLSGTVRARFRVQCDGAQMPS